MKQNILQKLLYGVVSSYSSSHNAVSSSSASHFLLLQKTEAHSSSDKFLPATVIILTVIRL